ILYRQRGTKISPGEKVGRGAVDTLSAKSAAVVNSDRKGPAKKQVSVFAVPD
ncbi:50S ribosomal protein L27, partial [Staphylococcus aureus]|uniref:50S ribosomal protein L27 n=1 Tax=Staphylococcus aureus TaxID=1280 RepID=UPI00210BFB3C